MPTALTSSRKNLTPKHVMLKHELLGVAPLAPIDTPAATYPVSRRRAPFSHRWLSTLVLGYHSPTWATALALSAMLLSEDLSRNNTQHKRASDSREAYSSRNS